MLATSPSSQPRDDQCGQRQADRHTVRVSKIQNTLARGDTRLIKLSASASVSRPPDSARVTFTCHSCKARANEAKESVLRRGEYISKIARQHGVKAKDILTSNAGPPFVDDPTGDAPEAAAQCDVAVDFTNLQTAETVCNVLYEKLARRLTIRRPRLTYREDTLQEMKHRALLKAVESVQERATDVARLLRLHLGPPLNVEEEHNCLRRNNEEVDNEAMQQVQHSLQLPDSSLRWPELIESATVSAYAQVNVTFELREKHFFDKIKDKPHYTSSVT